MYFLHNIPVHYLALFYEHVAHNLSPMMTFDLGLLT